MQKQTKAIVLSTLNYKDTSLIVRCYTQKFGLQSYILHHVLKNKKGKINIAYFQLLSQLEIQFSQKSNQTLSSISEVKIVNPYYSLHTNVYKSSVIMFLAEILQNVVIEEEENIDLYHFIETSLSWYDLHDFDANFHLIFLLKLSKHLGIYPDVQKTHLNFFVNEKTPDKINSLNTLLGINFDTLNNFKLNASIRNDILDEIINYFSVHLGEFKKPKSQAILHNVFK